MTMHSSLRSTDKTKQHRSVLKRLEKLVHLIKKDQWKEKNPVFGLPKVKVLKFKVKKEKVKEAEEAAVAAAEGAEVVQAAGAGATEGAKPQASKQQAAKTTAVKPQTAAKKEPEKGDKK